MQLKIGEIASLNAASQSSSMSEFFSERFVGLLLRKSESKTAHHNPHSFCVCVLPTKMVFAVVDPLACFVLLGTVSLALPVNSPVLFVLRVLRA